jgi:ABC-type Fe3+-hydroxamate transport system substrate-binding protein
LCYSTVKEGAVARVTDDLGTPMAVAEPVRRVVSLVPSLTESVAATAPQLLVGATDWCTHPPDLAVRRVRGTKNPDLQAITALRPDLVLANKEENRELDVRRLRDAGVNVWITDIRSVEQALTSLARMFTDALQLPVPDWLAVAGHVWSRPQPAPRLRAAISIWRDPWMVVGSATFTGDLARRLGLDNVFAGSADRYPHTSVDEIMAREPEVVVLPDEPYRFTPDDGPEAFPGLRTVLVKGRSLTWYGPSLISARQELLEALGPRTVG